VNALPPKFSSKTITLFFPLPCVGNSCYHCSIRISKILPNHRQMNLN
jgi:hypothetical protein